MEQMSKDFKNRRRFLSLTALVLLAVGVMIVTSHEWVQCDPLVVVTLLVNIALFLTQLLRAIDRHPFSFDMMFWLFSLVFFGYVPMLQHFADRYFWSLVTGPEEVVVANVLVLVWSGCYILGRDVKIPALAKLGGKVSAGLSRMEGKFSGWVSGKILKKKDARGLVMNGLLALSVVICVIDVSMVGLTGQFTRSTASVDAGSTMMNLLVQHGFNNTLLFVAVLYVIEAKREKKLGWKCVLALACLGIACFPTGLPRNMMASFYAGLLIVMFDGTEKGRWFSWVILAGLVLVFPAVEIFRRMATLENGNILAVMAEGMQSCYLQGHYDAHQMIITIRRYVQEFGLSWGGQLLGALLFFVPRAIWPGKPEGTGHTAIVALEQNQFSNVSAPLIAEGYVNFGLVGVILLALAVGVLVRKLDGSYWNGDKSVRLVRVIYPFSMFMFFFLLRGDMMSAGAYTAAQLLVGSLIYGLYHYSGAREK